MTRAGVLVALTAPVLVTASEEGRSAANPIRKVVNLLQSMQKKVESEREAADDLYKKFMCYCQTSGGDLQASISAAETKIPEVGASIKAATGQKVQLEADLKSHQTDRAAAKKAMAEATALREKEKAAYDKTLSDNKANLAATIAAYTAIEKGMAGSFLQTTSANLLRSIVASRQNMVDADRQEVLSFLSGQQAGEYAPASSEIVGILKQMADTMAGDQKDMIATEKDAVQTYEALMAAKKKEIAALQKALEAKMARVGDLGVEIVTMQNDAADTADALEEDKKFAADMKKNCAEKTDIHEREQKVRAKEIVAIADTISILNSDDALELFKGTLPSASSSFLQVQKSEDALRLEASRLLSKSKHDRLDFILLALRGRKVGFEKIVKLIDNLVVTLKAEQEDDDHKKEYCEIQFDSTDDKKKGLERSLSDLETAIADSKEGIATLAEEIKALKASIIALDKQVADATEQRKAEAAEYASFMKSDTAAKEVILFAKNRLNQFYNPSLYKPPPKRELSEGDQIYVNEGGDIPTAAPGGISNTGITAFVQVRSRKDAPPPPPATAAAYTKKSGESGGVIAMMDLLVKDLDEEMTIAETEEKNSQKEYEETIADAAVKRRQDSKSLTDKEGAKADLETSLEKHAADRKSTAKELMGTTRYIASLHAECDWLMKYYSVRKQARADEVDSLVKAKAVLAGADYSLLQRARAGRFLRGA
jgi:hypothetical protein